MFFENHYQIAYVTPDIRVGSEILRAQFGVPTFRGLGGDVVVENRVWTPDGEADIGMRAAVATVGDLTIEILEPVSGATAIFTQMLLPDQPLRVHHFGMRCKDVEAVGTEHERQGRKVVMAGGYNGAQFIYVDARATLGHFLEYASASPEYWERRARGEG